MKANGRLLPSLHNTLGWAATGVGVFLVAHALYREITKFKLEGKVVLITGGSRGLGLIMAREFAACGAKVAICARSADKVELARQELAKAGTDVVAIPADVTDRNQVDAMIKDVIGHYGRLDVLVNNAGTIQVGPQEAMLIDDYEEAMNVNFWAPLYAIHAAMPHFRKQGEGRIVNITSIGGKLAVPHLLPYSASKFAAVGLSEGMHAELKRDNVHVVTVVPNLMNTGSPRNITVKGNHEQEYAWFKTAGASPLLAQNAVQAARSIIKAVEHNEREAILSLSGKLATIVKGLAPGWVGIAMTLANKLLPSPTGNTEAKKGYESESSYSQNLIARRADEAAVRNNEM